MNTNATWTEVCPIGDLLKRAAMTVPNRRAVVFPDAACTYSELWEGAQNVARGLVAHGLQPGDHVGLLAVNGIPFLEGLFGALLAGCVVVPINARHRADEIGYIIENADLAAILTTASDDEYTSFTTLLTDALPGLADAADPAALALASAPKLRVAALLTPSTRAGFLSRAALDDAALTTPPATIDARRAQSRVRDVAMILYTSGTTANPKGCLLTHEALARGTVERATGRFKSTDHDVHWNGGPLFHIAAFGPLIGCIGAGITFLSDTFYDPRRALDLMKREGVTMAWPWFPAILQGLMDLPDFNPTDLPHLDKMMMIGPEALSTKALARFPDVDLMQACGMTETSGIFAYSTATDSRKTRLRTQGKMAPGMICRIVNPDTGAPCPDGTVGEIQVRGYCVTEGYYRAPDKTAETLVEGGWLRTGDMYERTPEGDLIFNGRYKDMLKVGGENVAAVEIEAFLVTHPAVRTAEIVGRADPRLDEVPVAFVELEDGHDTTAEAIIAFCQGKIARYKIPTDIIFMSPGTWPMSATKVNKRALRERLK